jgi:DNA-binding SARP family transcriptional activator
MGHVAATGQGRRPPGRAPLESVRLRLTTEFELLVGGSPVSVPHAPQRLLAYLALARHPVDRPTLGGALWPDVPQRQANGSLRSALWRCNWLGDPILRLPDERLALDPTIDVDVDDLADAYLRITSGNGADALGRLPELIQGAEILPTWDEEWLVGERERYRQLRLHALERAGELLLAAGEYVQAIDIGLAVLQSEPLRESAHRLVVQVHLHEGNLTDAVRQYRRYEGLLREELDVPPSPRMATIMESLGASIDPAPGSHRRPVRTGGRTKDIELPTASDS